MDRIPNNIIMIFILGLAPYFMMGQMDTLQTETIPGIVTVRQASEISQLYRDWVRSNKGTSIPGFRIQIFNGNKKGAFDSKSRFLKSGLNYPVTIVYETPEYKTQIGNFRNRLEAERALVAVREIDRGAFVVKTRIDLPDLPKKEKPARD